MCEKWAASTPPSPRPNGWSSIPGRPGQGRRRQCRPAPDESDPDRKAPKIEDLFIDIGVDSRKAAEKSGAHRRSHHAERPFELLRNDLAIARAFDNRVGTFAVAEALRQLAKTKENFSAEILAVSNIMEEVGLLGARQIAYTLKPDVALVVDVTHATDYPTVSQQQHGDIKIGHGPAITHGGCNHPEVVARLEEVRSRKKSNYSTKPPPTAPARTRM